ncbi:caspase family protein [Mesorhizobium sp. M0184]|uniref:caspase family protein n=1 Tax=unclassified Mesorhizobium TaxID=325217 RepID=UPI0033357E70
MRRPKGRFCHRQSDYRQFPALKNPARDAEDVSKTFRLAGFEVFVASDLTKLQFEEQFRNYLAAADGADLAVVYYSGHGFQIGGENFLIPVDASLKQAADIEVQAIKLNDVLEQLRSKSKIILDRQQWIGGIRLPASLSTCKGIVPGLLTNELAAARWRFAKPRSRLSDVPRFRYELGRGLLAAGKVEEGSTAIEEAAKTGHVRAVFELGYMYATGNRNGRRPRTGQRALNGGIRQGGSPMA